ncbi:MAG: prolipoprotein diacylglyceryl transferase [Endomicrobia bacterium]|nr:prolipoprotein diacylglyceryl transferase [Endomicrobiia bacterium]
MNPTLIRIGEITLRTYGLFVAIGVLLGYNYTRYIGSKMYKFDLQFMSNLLFYTILVGFLGGRLFYVLINFDYYRSDLLSVFKIWEGGLVYYGGFLLSLFFGVIYVRFKNKKVLDILDVASPGLYLGLFFGRLGCFFAGCCYGKPTESFLGVVFNNPESLSPIGIKLLPTQLFESFYSLLIFILLHFLLIKGFLKNRLFFLGGIIYSVFRFFNEFIRGDDRGVFIFRLSISQWISIIIFFLFFFLFFYIKNGQTDNKS